MPTGLADGLGYKVASNQKGAFNKMSSEFDFNGSV
jgi:hypothetical protein